MLSSPDQLNLLNQLLQMLLSHSSPQVITQCLRSLRNVFKHYTYRVKALVFRGADSLALQTVPATEEVQLFLGKKLQAALEIIYSQIFCPNLSCSLRKEYLQNYLEYSRYHLENCLSPSPLHTSCLFQKWCIVFLEP